GSVTSGSLASEVNLGQRSTLSSRILAAGSYADSVWPTGRDGLCWLGVAGHSRLGEPGDVLCGCYICDQFYGDLARPAAQPLVIDDQAEQRSVYRLHDCKRGKERRQPVGAVAVPLNREGQQADGDQQVEPDIGGQ